MVKWFKGFRRKKKEDEQKVSFYNPDSKLQNNSDERGSTQMAKDEFDEDDFDEEEVEEDLDTDEVEEEVEETPKPVKKPVQQAKVAPKPVSSVKPKASAPKAPVAVEDDVIAVVEQLPSQQITRALVEGKPTKFETLTEALTALRNDIAAIKKAVGA